MTTRYRVIAVATSVGLVAASHAQYRENQPQVLAPAPTPTPQKKLDPAHELGPAYARAGRPRIVLYWNDELTDQASATRADVAESRFDARAGVSDFSETARSVYARDVLVRERRTSAFTPRDAALVVQAFTAEFSRAGVHFVDRSLIIRSTAVRKHRTGADPQLIESDALAQHADLLMEVVQVPDVNAALGYAFDIRVKNLKRSMQIASAYSLGVPPQEVLPTQWVATEQGYELQQVGERPVAGSAADVGKAVAHDAMAGLSQALRAQ